MDRPGLVTYDAEVRLHDEALRRACGVQPHEHVLDRQRSPSLKGDRLGYDARAG